MLNPGKMKRRRIPIAWNVWKLCSKRVRWDIRLEMARSR